MLLVTKLGLRVGDIRALCLGDIDWENSRLSFIQSKTQKRVDLPLPDDVGWAIIDYLKYGRPKTTIQNVFLTGRTPIMAFSDTSSLSGIIVRYARMAKLIYPSASMVCIHCGTPWQRGSWKKTFPFQPLQTSWGIPQPIR